MRTFGKLAPVWSLVLFGGLFGGPVETRMAQAQGHPSFPAFSPAGYSEPGGVSLGPASSHPNAGFMPHVQPVAAPVGPPPGAGGPPPGAGGPPPGAGMGPIPPGWNPYPQISPFDNQYERLANDGIWFRDAVRGARRKKYLEVDLLIWDVKVPNATRIGAPGVDPIFDDPDPTDDDPGIVTFGFAQADSVYQNNVGPDDLRFDLIGHERVYNPSIGLMIRHGWTNPDGSAMEWRAWWLSDNTWTFKRGITDQVPDAVDPTDTDAVEALAELTRVTASLPLIDDTDDGTVVFYDILYRINLDTTSAGTGLNYYLIPFVNKGNIKVQWFGGLRYMFIGERFDFFGIDSGLDITFNQDGTPQTDTATVVVDPFFGQLEANMRTHLFGPQIGMRANIGGKNFKLSIMGALGLAANREDIEIRGQGIGNGFEAFDQFATFQDQKGSTHVSPIFEFSVNAEMKILHFIPGIRKIKGIENTRFIAGWSMLGAGEIARPWDSIEWRGQPFSPEVQINRTEWYAYGWKLGIIGNF